ncbi:MAG: hypothetical protein CMH64_02685 [Nanoarchaeota archaeon]|nr:hypothetical protein [Nanoarchaeota archaeon]|tara:strand:- start:1194 stop:1496 length:303 start_codon:yes stop_codon:yes gene_type:complete
MTKHPIETIEEYVSFGDLIELAFPLENATDFVTGYYQRADRSYVYLSRAQKSAIINENPDSYPRKPISTFEILKEFKPDPENDELDKRMLHLLKAVRKQH